MAKAPRGANWPMAISWTAKPCSRDLELYCADADRSDPRLSPLLAGEFSGLPPAFIHTGQFDPFGDEGEAYAAQTGRGRRADPWPHPSRHDPLFLLHAAHDPLCAEGRRTDRARRSAMRWQLPRSGGTPDSEPDQAGTDPGIKRRIQRRMAASPISA